ncbi:MAG: PspC domain-containing protein [Bacteroidales bacterium]|nr:PspC domain-containing protein [Bacteroidales bacterium]
MKKTFTINVSGIIFHIDEDAYERLNNYINSVKSHFSKADGKEEIINDIESRIAEILQEKITDSKQVINIEDIKHVISIMGQPFEFDEEDEQEKKEEPYYYQARPVKRLYRDTEDSVIAGICSGIAAYFHTDPIWFRIGFIIALFSGFGFFLYLILWIAIPEARTTAERLEMRGEKVNISNIEKSIGDEVNNLKDKINDLTNQAKTTYKKKSTQYKPGYDHVLIAFGNIFKYFFKAIIIFIGIILFFVGISLFIAFLASIFGWGGFGVNEHSDIFIGQFPIFADRFLGGIANIGLLKVGLFFLIGVPLIMLLYSAVRLIFNIDKIKYIGFTAFNIWIAGLIITAYFAFKIVKDFRYQDYSTKEYMIEQPKSDILYLDVKQNRGYNNYYENDYTVICDDGIIITEDGKFYREPMLRFEESDTDQYQMIIYSYARGKSRNAAKKLAGKTIYNINQNDSLLTFDSYFELPDYVNWRDQYLRIELLIPIGKKIHLSYDMDEIIDYHRNYYPYNLPGKTWIMTTSGLKREINEVSLKEEKESDQDVKRISNKKHLMLNIYSCNLIM